MPTYQGKPTLYLDQNMLDLFIKYRCDDFQSDLREKYQIVYSDETLREIKRSKGYEDKFLLVLKGLNAFHLKLVVEQPGFVATDRVTIADRDVFEAFQEYCENPKEYRLIERALMQLALKFSGGRAGDSISEVNEEQIEAFSQLMDLMEEISEDLPTEIQGLIKESTLPMKNQFKAALDGFAREIEKGVSDTRNWNAVKSFREEFKIGPKELNNIMPPDAIEKIWEIYKESKVSTESLGIEDFFQIRSNPISREQPYHTHQKVTAMYNSLNTFGYYPDSKIHKERRFLAAMSDSSHASMASFCNFLLSRDENFVKKVQAVYEYLKIPTVAAFLLIQDPDRTDSDQ